MGLAADDEGFIRAIVASPGDDLPRLAYADYLDERHDPRGAYLRAEAAWAAPWRDGRRPADDAAVRELANGLDPVWVARVSRPPAGVCCDHVRFTGSGPPLTYDVIDELERQLDGLFPADFRGFLLNYNGGRPVPGYLPFPEASGVPDLDLEICGFFNSTRRSGDVCPDPTGDWVHGIYWERDWMEELYESGGMLVRPNPLLVGLAPITNTMPDLGYFLIGISGRPSGRVFHFSDYCHRADQPDCLTEYAVCFSEFLTRLRPKRERVG